MHDPLGRQRSKTFWRKADALRFLVDIEADKARGNWIDPRGADMAVATWADEFMRLSRRLSPTTQDTYRRDLRDAPLEHEPADVANAHSEGVGHLADVEQLWQVAGWGRALLDDHVPSRSLAGRYECVDGWADSGGDQSSPGVVRWGI